jgi:ADP-dependent NAD(P)H-hydrate dehydratase / NAD(P)H-hydrate epimerase
MGEAIKANITLALHCKKIGHVLFPGVYFSGLIKVLDIGIRKSLNKIANNRIKENNPNLWINKKFPWKKYNSHKYSRGRVYIYGSLKKLYRSIVVVIKRSYSLWCWIGNCSC